MMGVSSINAQKSKYGKVLFTRESFKDVSSEIPYTVYEKQRHNIFGYKKEVVTIEFDLAVFIKQNKNLNVGAYDEIKFLNASKTLNCNVNEIYKQVENYVYDFASYNNGDCNLRCDLRCTFLGHVFGGLYDRITERWFRPEAWIEVKIIDNPILEQGNAIQPLISDIQNNYYIIDLDESWIYSNMDDMLLILLELHKLGYDLYPATAIKYDSFKFHSLSCN